MPSHFLSLCQFHFHRLLRANTIALIAVFASILALFILVFVFASQWQKTNEAEQVIGLEKAHSAKRSSANNANLAELPVLPSFSSALLVENLYQIAGAAGLPVDEVAFALDDTASQPFLRYRVKFAASARYPVIRKFIDQMSRELTHTSLDAISCLRDDVSDSVITCEMAISAFYRKSANG